MSGIQQLLLGGSAGGYQIQRSLRFNSADSAYLNRTPASAGNRRTWTWSAWLKRSNVSGTYNDYIFSAKPSVSVRDAIIFDTSDRISIFANDATSAQLVTTQVFRDFSSWYHIVVAVDTTQATASNRIKLYVNGTQVTAFGTATYPTQNYDWAVDNTVVHTIGDDAANAPTGLYHFNGYLTEVNFIDGQALTPSSFGQTNASTGVWEPIKYTGTYGTNGFYLNFSDNSNTTSTTLGKDYSGNGNNWTPNNFSVTAGAGNDSLVDTPTSYGVDTGVGGEVRGNYCTWNPLKQVASGITASNGNLDTVNTSDAKILGTIGMSSGKWYWEVTPTANGGNLALGIARDNTSLATNSYVGQDANSWAYNGTAFKYNNASGSAYGATYTNNDVIGVAFDADAGTLVFYKNGVSQGTAFSSLTSGPYFPAIGNSNASASANFGQRPFAYTAPSGFKALCTQNLPTPTIGATSTTQAGKYFNAVLYTGNGSTQSISGVGFQPDFVWNKSRSAATDHYLFDAVRGAGKGLFSTSTSAEFDYGTGSTSPNISFDSNGFTMGSNGGVNTNAATYVAWNWNAGGSNATNTSGTITSTVRANTTAGFSIVTYTGNGTNGATVGHGLGVAPSMVIYKKRNGTSNWVVYHTSIGATAGAFLDLTNAPTTSSSYFNNTAPSSTLLTLGNASAVNDTASTTHVAYCFAAVAGYSAFGSYDGNGSADGPFVYTGFRPRYILIKRTTNADNWFIFDTSRSPFNVTTVLLYTNLANAEATFTSLDILSNGFKIRTSDAGFNASANTYIYAAFAESPFKYALAR